MTLSLCLPKCWHILKTNAHPFQEEAQVTPKDQNSFVFTSHTKMCTELPEYSALGAQGSGKGSGVVVGLFQAAHPRAPSTISEH